MEKTPLKAQMLQLLDDYESRWQEKLDGAREHIGTLEDENARLRADLQKEPTALDEITDDALRERLSQLGQAPSDTVIREAGVVLEDRLRTVIGADTSLHGTRLVEAALSPKTGGLVFSSHRGEQEGVHLLYRGALQFIRNPPMHKLMEYTDDTAVHLVRLIDSLLQLLSEGVPRGQASVANVRRMLSRRRVPRGQKQLYEALLSAGDQGLSKGELGQVMGRSRHGVSGVLGALGNRINNTEGLQGKGIGAIFEISRNAQGDWHYRMRPVLRKALEEEGIVKAA